MKMNLASLTASLPVSTLSSSPIRTLKVNECITGVLTPFGTSVDSAGVDLEYLVLIGLGLTSSSSISIDALVILGSGVHSSSSIDSFCSGCSQLSVVDGVVTVGVDYVGWFQSVLRSASYCRMVANRSTVDGAVVNAGWLMRCWSFMNGSERVKLVNSCFIEALGMNGDSSSRLAQIRKSAKLAGVAIVDVAEKRFAVDVDIAVVSARGALSFV